MPTYDHFAESFARSRHRMRWGDIDSLLESVRAVMGEERFREARVLDVGCGGGRLLDILRECWWTGEYLGIDDSESMVESARTRYPDSSFRTLDMRDIDALDGPFDLVLFIASLHHLESREDRLRTLSAAKAVLVLDGLVGMTNWNLRHPKALRKYTPLTPDGRDYLIPLDGFPRYYRAFDPAELAGLFAETDYRTIRNDIGERNIVSLVWNFLAAEYTRLE